MVLCFTGFVVAYGELAMQGIYAHAQLTGFH